MKPYINTLAPAPFELKFTVKLITTARDMNPAWKQEAPGSFAPTFLILALPLRQAFRNKLRKKLKLYYLTSSEYERGVVLSRHPNGLHQKISPAMSFTHLSSSDPHSRCILRLAGLLSINLISSACRFVSVLEKICFK